MTIGIKAPWEKNNVFPRLELNNYYLSQRFNDFACIITSEGRANMNELME